MDEDVTIINANTRVEKYKNFFLKNRKNLIGFVSLILLILIVYFGYIEYKKKQKIQISYLYNSSVIEFNKNKQEITKNKLIDIVKKKDSTYSPLAMYFIIDNDLIIEAEKINDLFDLLIDKTPLNLEIKNLIIYKKALFNADNAQESELLDILNPLMNSESVWRSHALYLAAEYFFSKGEKQKSKEFFNQILNIENANQDIIKEVKKRLNRDLSD